MSYETDYFDYPVLSDKEIESLKKVLEPGIHNFEVLKADKRPSKAGNPMVELVLKIWNKEGQEFQVWDWLVGIDSMAFKTKHFWESVGQPDKYTGKTLVAEFVGKCGKVKTGVRKDDKGNERPNVIDYVPGPIVAKVAEAFDDDISF